ncbi:hypothetical protein L1987_61194 [Smallanthus sonchifolius]|uniref:Uncharacterized protein n=1 Tax=Smallanthus sonchifolius TaxID=185202 RepID=A0ACB9DA25_9ASTR|nr:hypothetical protein L1987_61194 [Smallanthus sonchifolius]
MTTAGGDLHVVFLPFFTSSHIIPLVHAARLFAARGVRSTILTTVNNALIFKASVDHDTVHGYPIFVHTLNFPSSEVGLPIGIESMNSAPTREMAGAVFRGMMMLQTPMQQAIRHLAPDCIFSDMFFPWTVDLADELKIPRLLFYPSCFLYHSISHSLRIYKPHEKVESESESFVVPHLPDEITMKRSQMSEHFKTKTAFGEMIELILQSEKRSYGLVHNTFYELEPAYVDHFKKIKDTKVWHIGPLFQFFNNEDNCNSNVLEKHACLSWLDDQKPNSVIYGCFGSMVRFQEAQITEIAFALEESKQPFIWVVGKTGNEGIGGLPEGFEERVKRENKGLIITEWAPQVEILQHPAVGGFLTHCGWNSVLEAVVAGVPLMTWPLYAEHFYNEKLVELLGIGVRVGVDVWNLSNEITSPIIGKRGIIEAIEVLIGESTMAESIRLNSKELAMKTKKVVEEGGSSVNDLKGLIQELKAVKLAAKP